MSSEDLSRRSMLKLGGSVVAVAALSGCSGVLDNSESSGEPTDTDDGDSGGDDSSDTAGPLASVPAGADFAMRADVSRVLADEQLRENINGLLTTEGSPGSTLGQENVGSVLDRAQEELGLDPRGLSEAVVYLQVDKQRSVAILDADWTQSTVKSAVENGAESVTSTQYSGQTIYEMEGGALGVLPDGRYVLSNTAGTREAIDLANGDVERVSGDLQTAYDAAPEGYMRFAGVAPKGWSPQGNTGPVSAETYESMRYGYGALYRGDTRGGEVTLELDSADAAESVATAIKDGKATAAQELASDDLSQAFAGDPSEMIESTTVSRTEGTVTVKSTDTQGMVPTMGLAVLGTFVLGFGASAQTPTPAASFSFEYEAETLTITHTGGDSIPATRLRIEGSGLGQTGFWNELSPEHAAGDRVTAGDRVELDAESDLRVRIVWESPEGESSAVLASYRGPDA